MKELLNENMTQGKLIKLSKDAVNILYMSHSWIKASAPVLDSISTQGSKIDYTVYVHNQIGLPSADIIQINYLNKLCGGDYDQQIEYFAKFENRIPQFVLQFKAGAGIESRLARFVGDPSTGDWQIKKRTYPKTNEANQMKYPEANQI